MAIFFKGIEKMTLKTPWMFLLAWILVLTSAIYATTARAEETKVLKTDKDRLSYAIGYETGRTIAKAEADIDEELIIRGMKDGMGNASPLAPERELRKVMNAFRGQIYAKTTLSQRAAKENNKNRGAEFLASNKKREGVVTLPSGVQYKVLVPGSGKPPVESDTIEYRFRGSLLNGSEFARTEDGQKMRQSIQVLTPVGWKEAVKQMPVGAKWQIWVPSSLGYGERGVGEDIGPNELLIYEVELLNIVK